MGAASRCRRKRARLLCAAEGVVLRVEVSDDLLSGEIEQTDLISVFVREGKIRGFLIDFEHEFICFNYITDI